MPYVSCKYTPPNPEADARLPEGVKRITCVDDADLPQTWHLTDDSDVRDFTLFIKNGGTIDPADPVAPPQPVLNHINRAVGIIGNQPVAMTCHGANFLPTSVVFVDNKLKRNAVFISDSEITCTVDPMNETPRSVEVYVKTGTHMTEKKMFTFITREAPA